MATLSPPHLDTADALAEQVIAWRRHLHARPELAWEEHGTSGFVAETLAAIGAGAFVITRPTATSVMARLTGRGAGAGRTIALRADMDALPIHEENDVAYRSQVDGKMHACGHDGHTAMLLGVARSLVATRDQWAGEVRFLFQHAEEQSPGGAEEMVQAGVMDGVDAVAGVHLWAGLEYGQIGVLAGPMMAAPDNFFITVRGSGGHAAQPHLCVDPIAIGAQLVTTLQHIVARRVDPLDPAVVTVTYFRGGTTTNVIPDSAELWGTVRTFDPTLRANARTWIEQMTKGVCEAHDATYEFRWLDGYRPVVNDPAVATRLQDVIRREFGDQWLADMRPSMGGEDFSAFQQKAPGAFAFVGAGHAASGIVHPHHHPRFQIDERALSIGVRYLTAAARELLMR
ncbi:MAG: amidohydrolase [Gemmatimonadaceae bacterium]|jgi:amidohydrolase|nr:amidohydrolase [Gemmatimonadaceae bacterium]